MKILVLGGTGFLGRTFVEHAIERGHEVTLFNRGQRNPALFPELEQLRGDRGVDVSALDGRSWDAVYDTSGYFPRVVAMSAEKLRDAVGTYLFISSISVFKNFDVPNQDEDGEVETLVGPVVEEITAETYGALKFLCENTVKGQFGDRAIVVRPGLVVGPYDYSDRFTYWPVRMQRGGDVLVPDVKEQPSQFIDVRDLVEFCLGLIERGTAGVFNATGPERAHQLGDVLTQCAAGTAANLVWADGEFLTENNVQPWMELPLAMGFNGETIGQTNVSRAVSAGLRFRALGETIRDTREWANTRSNDHLWRAGLTAEREAELLNAWKARSTTNSL